MTASLPQSGSPSYSQTPQKYYVYDQSTGLNSMGRLGHAYTCPANSSDTCSSWTTDLGFVYTPRGGLTSVYELTPHPNSGYYNVSATYWANGLINTLNSCLGSLPTWFPATSAAKRAITPTIFLDLPAFQSHANSEALTTFRSGLLSCRWGHVFSTQTQQFAFVTFRHFDTLHRGPGPAGGARKGTLQGTSCAHHAKCRISGLPQKRGSNNRRSSHFAWFATPHRSQHGGQYEKKRFTSAQWSEIIPLTQMPTLE